MGSRLFSPGDATDPIYVNLRDIDDEHTRVARAFAEHLWDGFRRFADPHFLTEVRRDFHARFWEMYLTCSLERSAAKLGAVLSCPKPGPDILFERGGKRIWIEAVVATNGIAGAPDSVVEPNTDGSGKIPEEKLVLRYANSISEKYRKYQGYLKGGFIQPNDAFVIAINGAALSYKWTRAQGDAPRFLKAVYPIGVYQLLLDRHTGKIVGEQNEPRFSIPKASGKHVETMTFLEKGLEGISAIVGSYADVTCHRTELGFDFEVAHNPMARVPVVDSTILAKKSWKATLTDDGAELTGHML